MVGWPETAGELFPLRMSLLNNQKTREVLMETFRTIVMIFNCAP